MLLALVTLPALAEADEAKPAAFISGDYAYALLADGTAEIVK